MKVQELIRMLTDTPQDIEIVVRNIDGKTTHNVHGIHVDLTNGEVTRGVVTRGIVTIIVKNPMIGKPALMDRIKSL